MGPSTSAVAQSPLVRKAAVTVVVFQCPARDRNAAALAAWRPAITARHAGGSGGFVEEHEVIRIEFGLSLEPGLASRPHIRALLLSCVRRPFFRVTRWRWKKRDRPLVLVCTPC